MESILFEVSGLDNSQKKTKIKNSLDKVKGVQEVSVDMDRGTIEVGFNLPATGETIETKIEKQGCVILN
ncbi:heavy-metal-associated domain-containing protein [Clostridium sp. DL1XJH146]